METYYYKGSEGFLASLYLAKSIKDANFVDGVCSIEYEFVATGYLASTEHGCNSPINISFLKSKIDWKEFRGYTFSVWIWLPKLTEQEMHTEYEG